ncbi:MAG: ABC transporter substrate-binding protein [Candidatus Accumulibacter sp.]|jgi:branched-chain amino acid transport system substrate-binding protein|nr:ABC transporter substrate-binding protein [Accumulibacter sp.]
MCIQKLRSIFVAALLFAPGFFAGAQAQEEIRIGAIYPLTGAAASTGLEMRHTLELAADMINNGAKGINMPLAAGGGLPNLKNAKIRLIFADHQGNPQVGATEAERLILQEKVVALIGCYFSNVTATASVVAERNGIPFLNPESSSAKLTQRKLKWFFRTTPHDDLFVHNFYEFLKDVETKKGFKSQRIAILNENTEWGVETSRIQVRLAKELGYNIVESINYPAKSTQLTSEVQRLKASNADLLMQSSYLGDAILAMKTFKEQGFAPKAILANDAGFSDTEFRRTLGKDANFVFSREVWAKDLTTQNPLIKQVNDLYAAKHNTDFNGNSARSFTGLFVLADAINRAGSTAPEAIRKALSETNIPGNQLIMPWSGVKFDAAGQNTLGRGIIVQIQDGEFVTVWPFDIATKDLIWPMPAWDKR